MALLAETLRQAGIARLDEASQMPRLDSTRLEFTVPYRSFDQAAGTDPMRASFTITLLADATLPGPQHQLKAAAAFLIDAVHGAVALPALARMIGNYALTTVATAEAVTLSLASSAGGEACQRVARPVGRCRDDGPGFEIETTAFGAAHILYEDETLGLYILEIAAGHKIPAHCHRVMREWELILDDGLLQQGRPVRRGDAFAWPLGHVHAYDNPTDRALRILCVDSPRFDPADEVPLAAPPRLVPVAPVINYFD